MIRFETDNASCIVVGAGLVGSAIGRALHAAGWRAAEHRQPDWADHRKLSSDLVDLVGAGEKAKTDLIWSAGRAGFGATEVETEAEFRFFEAVFASLQATFGGSLRPHLVGSAGGLHEGDRYVDDPEAARPTRAYGHLKLAQEQLLNTSYPNVVLYRLSSVFGIRQAGMRRSLMSELIDNGVTGKVTVVTGSPATLRDYVFAEDVGRGVTKLVETDRNGIHYFVSGRPVSIAEAVVEVQRLLGRPILVRYGPQTNSQPITFSPRVRSAAYVNTPLSVAISQIHQCRLAIRPTRINRLDRPSAAPG